LKVIRRVVNPAAFFRARAARPWSIRPAVSCWAGAPAWAVEPVVRPGDDLAQLE
jgi:hypothetical protein